MSVIAGLQDFRHEAPPADIGVYLFPATTLVFKYIFGGTTYICAVRSGERGWVLVDYGTDAATVINSALASANKVFVMAGSYTINIPILIQGKNNVVLEGEGWRSTRLITSGADTICIKVGDRSNASLACTNIIIRGFYIDCSSQTTETSFPETVDRRFGIEFASPNNETQWCIVEDCYIYNTGSDSIYMYIASPNIVRNCIIKGTRGFWAALHCHDPPNAGIFIGNVILNSAVSAIRHGALIAYNYIEGAGKGQAGDGREVAIVGGGYNGCIVVNNYVFTNYDYNVVGIQTFSNRDVIIGNTIAGGGINACGVRVLHEGVLVVDNLIQYDSDFIGILVENTKGAVIKGNSINRVKYEGIKLVGAQRCIVQGNVIARVSKDNNNTYDAIRLETYGTNTYSTHNIISGNQIWSDLPKLPRYGIVEADTNQDYNIIANNIVTNCATAAINKQGVNSILDNNITS